MNKKTVLTGLYVLSGLLCAMVAGLSTGFLMALYIVIALHDGVAVEYPKLRRGYSAIYVGMYLAMALVNAVCAIELLTHGAALASWGSSALIAVLCLTWLLQGYLNKAE